MTDSLSQKIYDIIQPTLPDGWVKIVLFTAFMQESCEIKYFVKGSAEIKFRDCFEIVDNHIVLFKILSDLRDVISEERNKKNKNEQWKFATITIDSEGNFEIFFDYSDSFWDDQEFFIQWSNNFLR